MESPTLNPGACFDQFHRWARKIGGHLARAHGLRQFDRATMEHEAEVALWRAIQSYESARGIGFKSHAGFRINRACHDYLRSFFARRVFVGGKHRTVQRPSCSLDVMLEGRVLAADQRTQGFPDSRAHDPARLAELREELAGLRACLPVGRLREFFDLYLAQTPLSDIARLWGCSPARVRQIQDMVSKSLARRTGLPVRLGASARREQPAIHNSKFTIQNSARVSA